MRSRGIHRNPSETSRRGVALVFALAIAVILGGLAWALLVMNLSTEKVRVEDRSSQRKFYAAEAGLSDAYVRMTSGLVDPRALPATIGSADAPIVMGPTAYWVSIESAGSRSYDLRSTGIADGGQQRLEMVLGRRPNGFFQYAAFGAEGVRLDSNAFIDSFDSALGTYESQVQGGNDFALEHGNVGSNHDIVLRSNTEIHGDCTPGPTGIVDDSAPRTYVSGSTDPAEEEFPMPPIVVPDIPSSGSMVRTTDLVLGPGEVHLTSLRMQGGTTLTLRGPATIVLDDYLMRSGATMIFDATNGEIELHGTGDFVLESNTVMQTISRSAVDVTILLSGNNMDAGRRNRIQLSSNAEFVGAIYAPRIEYSLNSNFDVYGSIICGRLDLSSNGEIHFDEALLYDGQGDPEYDVRLWHVLPPLPQE